MSSKAGQEVFGEDKYLPAGKRDQLSGPTKTPI